MKATQTRKLMPLLREFEAQGRPSPSRRKRAAIRELLVEGTRTLPGYCFEISMVLHVCDDEENDDGDIDEHLLALRVLEQALSSNGGGEPLRCHGDVFFARYLVDGEIHWVPDDVCPRCWEEWSFKLSQTFCSWCGSSLGREIKFLLDTGVCPACREGTVSPEEPECSKCDFVAEGSMVAWG